MRTAATFLAMAATLPAAAQADRAEALKLRRTPIVAVYESCKASVVNIAATQTVEVQRPYDDFDRLFGRAFDVPRTVKTTSVGSGFVIHSTGYIVTNAHVVARTAERKVVFADKRELDAALVGVDTENDLALLKVETDRPLPEIKLGRSDDLMVGETVVAMGNPLGLGLTVTTGVVSALDRHLQVDERVGFRGLVQTDASINPGNSGGPLLNVLGELIGVNFAIRGDGQNIGFAIPVERLGEVLPALLDVEGRYRLVTGFTVTGTAEARVATVAPDQPAANAGLLPEDRIVALAGRPVTKAIDVPIGLIGRKPGDRVPLTVVREGKAYQATITLSEKPRPDGKTLARGRLGLEVDAVAPPVARRLGLRRATGVMVMRVDPEGPAAETGLEPNDVLLLVGRAQIGGLDDLGRLLESLPAGEPASLTLLRPGGPGVLYRIMARVTVR